MAHDILFKFSCSNESSNWSFKLQRSMIMYTWQSSQCNLTSSLCILALCSWQGDGDPRWCSNIISSHRLLAHPALDQQGEHRVGQHRHGGLQHHHYLGVHQPSPHLQHVGEQGGEGKAVSKVTPGAVTMYLGHDIIKTVHDWQNCVRGAVKKKKQYIYRHCPNWWWPPSLLPYFWQIYFWQSVAHVDLPPSPRIFDKNHEILGFETCILYYPHYFLRVRGTDRMTQSPFKWIFFKDTLQINLYGFPYYNGTI